MNEKMKEEIDRAVKVLRAGGLLLYPTDTVWGLGCDATNADAVAKIYALKKRSDSKSLVLLAAGMDMVCRYVKEIPEMAEQLVTVNDRPMTIIYPGALTGTYGLAENTVAEDGSVGMRIPMAEFPLELARRFGKPLVSTSANISGEPTPKNYSEISDDIRNGVDYCVDSVYEAEASGSASQIIKLGLDSSVEIIRA